MSKTEDKIQEINEEISDTADDVIGIRAKIIGILTSRRVDTETYDYMRENLSESAKEIKRAMKVQMQSYWHYRSAQEVLREVDKNASKAEIKLEEVKRFISDKY